MQRGQGRNWFSEPGRVPDPPREWKHSSHCVKNTCSIAIHRLFHGRTFVKRTVCGTASLFFYQVWAQRSETRTWSKSLTGLLSWNAASCFSPCSSRRWLADKAANHPLPYFQINFPPLIKTKGGKKCLMAMSFKTKSANKCEKEICLSDFLWDLQAWN